MERRDLPTTREALAEFFGDIRLPSGAGVTGVFVEFALAVLKSHNVETGEPGVWPIEEYASLPEVTIRRDAGAHGWEVAARNVRSFVASRGLIGEKVMEAVRRAGGAAVVSYRDDNSLSARLTQQAQQARQDRQIQRAYRDSDEVIADVQDAIRKARHQVTGLAGGLIPPSEPGPPSAG
jgi:hypothetical protein